MRFASGVEPEPLLPIERLPPIWVLANPSIGAGHERLASQAAGRLVHLDDGWMTFYRASHTEEVRAGA